MKLLILLLIPIASFGQIFNQLEYAKPQSLYPKSNYQTDTREDEREVKLKTKLVFSGFYKYQKDNGETSEYYNRTFEFTTGEILNAKTETNNYKVETDYALIWYGQGEVATIELDKRVFFSNVNRYGFTESDYNTLKLLFSILNPVTGKSKSGKVYTFCLTDYNICTCN